MLSDENCGKLIIKCFSVIKANYGCNCFGIVKFLNGTLSISRCDCMRMFVVVVLVLVELMGVEQNALSGTPGLLIVVLKCVLHTYIYENVFIRLMKAMM